MMHMEAKHGGIQRFLKFEILSVYSKVKHMRYHIKHYIIKLKDKICKLLLNFNVSLKVGLGAIN